ncbi:amino acid ABC transporter substrate-binding protein [Magnetospira sp. QH-2]|uniref:amino acid ABC transporter substrate-binding protein n=1 Tax=Magnetospira sp. (strain QH-2) TaxID=1288970 RepID=UPI0003E819FA|nr:amino acid ABC transporter substrate-binding protein [Magnetospira sp. QH-2]CCQ73656.1 Amino-acid transporter subunit; periplasmic-binding component of ABC superfamily [Magnetospira sp. QH-2]
MMLRILVVVLVSFGMQTAVAGTLDDVRERGVLRCGANHDYAGFSAVDKKGRWWGLDVDLCRAVAAAVLGSADAVEFLRLSDEFRFEALSRGDVDLLFRNTTETLSRDTALGFNFTRSYFYDGQGFMVWADLGARKLADLKTARVCVETGTTTLKTLRDFTRREKVTFDIRLYHSLDEMKVAFFSRECDTFSSDASALASILSTDAPKGNDFLILPERVSKEPLAGVVREGDEDWFDVVKWTLHGVIEAEEKGLTSGNLEQMQAVKDPYIQRLLGVAPGIGQTLGLDDQWLRRIIAQVGNYGEIYERNLGAAAPVTLDRGLNNLWTKGGLLYSPPFL